MTIVLPVALFGASILLFWLQGRKYDAKEQQLREEFTAERGEWVVERRELLNRIQAPDRVPVVQATDVEPFEVSEDLPELAKVGAVFHEDDGEGGDA